MRIGIDIRCLMSPLRAGVAEYTVELLTAILALPTDHDYYLLYNSYADFSAQLPHWSGDRIHWCRTRWPNKVLNTSLWLRQRPWLDELVEKGAGGPPLDYFFSPNLNFTALSSSVKFILTIHDLSFALFPDCYSPKMRLWHRLIDPRAQCERAAIILTPSTNTRRDVVEQFNLPASKVRCLYPGLSPQFSEPSSSTDEEIRTICGLPEKFILCLGTLEPRKNIKSVIAAYAQLPTELKNTYALVVAGASGWGQGDLPELIKHTPGVHYIGYVDAAHKPSLYRLASLFVYPSLYEGFGFPALEAMASGVPVITSNRSSLPEVVGMAGHLINPYNIDEISDSMRLLLSNATLRNNFIQSGFIQAKKFSWEKTAKEFLEVLEKN